MSEEKLTVRVTRDVKRITLMLDGQVIFEGQAEVIKDAKLTPDDLLAIKKILLKYIEVV